MNTLKTVGIMQPYLFPYLGYFALLKCVDEYVVLDNVQMIKGGWINRNNILLAGQPHRFTVKLRNSSVNRTISDVEVGDDFRSFRKLLVSAYAKAPHFAAGMRVVDEIIEAPQRGLATFIENSLRVLATYLRLSTPLVRASDLEISTDLKAQERVIGLCKALDADRYVNAVGGMQLYDRAAFAAEGLDLKFLRFTPKPYAQSTRDFVPNLSVIDAIMYASPEEVSSLLDSYELVDAD